MNQRLINQYKNISQDYLYIGLMSGTSIDGIDVALVQINKDGCLLLANHLHPIKIELKKQLNQICNPLPDTPSKLTHDYIEQLAMLDHQLGLLFAEAVNQLLVKTGIDKANIRAIGSHGQTIRHRPSNQYPFTLQIGDANLIAYHTGITTIADFRRMDMAAGGQGAPLVPAFHQALMQTNLENRIILNLGGIANITLLPKDPSQPVIGFDTGPANTLLDSHFKQHHPQADFDKNGDFAKTGKLNEQLLTHLLDDNYFKLKAPKSTGREYFSKNWLQQKLNAFKIELSPQSIQASLVRLTVQTIADSINSLKIENFSLYVCGGGMHNKYLLEQLTLRLQKPILTTNQIGVDGDYLEAMTFAWLAHQRLENLPGNLTAVTGAKQNKVLGAIYHP